MIWRTDQRKFHPPIHPEKSMVLNVGLLSYAIAALAYLALALLLAFVWRDRPFKNSLVIACGLTALWAGVIAGGT